MFVICVCVGILVGSGVLRYMFKGVWISVYDVYMLLWWGKFGKIGC